MARRLKTVAARAARRGLTVLLMLSFLVGTAGVPIVTRVAVEKDRSRPFPCQDNPCGCASAEECWQHCCCHTNREKVAWAHEHHVVPPDYVVAAAEREEPTNDDCPHHHACPKCLAKVDQARCAGSSCAKSAACPQHVGGHDPGAVAPKQKKSVRSVFVVTDLARRCRSLPQFWSLLAVALPVRIETAWSFDDSVVGRVIEPSSPRRCVELSPPVPPPKLELADA